MLTWTFSEGKNAPPKPPISQSQPMECSCIPNQIRDNHDQKRGKEDSSRLLSWVWSTQLVAPLEGVLDKPWNYPVKEASNWWKSWPSFLLDRKWHPFLPRLASKLLELAPNCSLVNTPYVMSVYKTWEFWKPKLNNPSNQMSLKYKVTASTIQLTDGLPLNKLWT